MLKLDSAVLPVAYAFNQVLKSQPGRLRFALQPFVGKSLGFTLDKPALTFTFVINREGGLEPLANPDFPGSAVPALPDVLIQLNGGLPRPPFSLGTLLAKAHIAGNAELAEALSFLLRNLRINPGDLLQPVLGDVLTHRIETGLQKIAGKIQDTLHRS